MDEETIKTHLNTLKEIILDDEKLCTYVSLSKEFCIHVNESKFLMIKAVEEIRKNHPDTVLNVNYVISGLAEDNKAFTYVCLESDITDYRKRFKVIFFEHIYSINKGRPVVDKVAYMAINKFDDYHLCSGLIKSNQCSKRTSDEIDTFKSKTQELAIDQKSIKPLPKKGKEEKMFNAIPNRNGDSKKAPEIMFESKVKQEKTSPKKEPIGSNKSNQEMKKTNKPQKGIAGFFSRSESAPLKKSTESKITDSEIKIKSEKETNKKIADESMDVDNDIVVNPKASKIDNTKGKSAAISDNTKNKSTSKTKSNNNNSLNEMKKNAKVDKKRKRVLHISDSESDDGKNDPFEDKDGDDVHNEQINFDSEDEIPPTPAINTIKITSGLLNPRKRRKMVNKTYIDDDGYMLTRKEEVYESLSENEELADTKENIHIVAKKSEASAKEKSETIKTEVSPKEKKGGGKSNKKKISPPQKGKQATLMSFFKKA